METYHIFGHACSVHLPSATSSQSSIFVSFSFPYPILMSITKRKINLATFSLARSHPFSLSNARALFFSHVHLVASPIAVGRNELAGLVEDGRFRALFLAAFRKPCHRHLGSTESGSESPSTGSLSKEDD